MNIDNYSYIHEGSLPNYFFKIATIQYLKANRLLRQYNLTFEQFVILYHIDKYQNLSQKDLSELVLKDQANTTRILKRLLIKKLAKISVSPKDRRMNLVNSTQTGKDLLDKILPIWEEELSNVKATLGDQFIDELTEKVIQYIEIIEKQFR